MCCESRRLGRAQHILATKKMVLEVKFMPTKTTLLAYYNVGYREALHNLLANFYGVFNCRKALIKK